MCAFMLEIKIVCFQAHLELIIKNQIQYHENKVWLFDTLREL